MNDEREAPPVRAAWAVFLSFFALYLWTLPPGLSPYRDAGEMSLSAYSLGVSHPPGYPLYVLLGRVAQTLLPFGDPARALAVLSALAGAGALAVLFRTAVGLFGLWPAAAAVLILGTNARFWSVAQVQEMYSLALLAQAMLLAGALSLERRFGLRRWCAGAFLFGLALGVRTDLLLLAPGLLWLSFPRAAWGRGRVLALAAGFAALGFSVFLYLPLRSSQGPWLDWNHPATVANLVASLTRRGYGATLDLLSKNYAFGSMFLPNLRVYAARLWSDFGPLGLLLAAAGLTASLRASRRQGAGELLMYAVSGPFFLLLANMPPNPHALAIVDPHYLLSDVLLAWWAARGGALFLAWRPGAPPWIGPALALCAALQPCFFGRLGRMDRRWDLTAHDFAGNVLRSAPPGAIVVAKKDVQLFSLWHYVRVRGRRSDLELIPQGLVHSPWFQDSHRRFGGLGVLSPLRDAEGWRRFLDRNGPERVWAAMDAEIHPGAPMGPPRGALMSFATAPASGLPWAFMVRRGDYRYEARPDFFSADLVASYATAYERLGAAYIKEGRLEEARRAFLAAWSMQWRSPDVASTLAFLYVQRGDLARSLETYELAGRLYDHTLELTRAYHTLPAARDAFRAAAASALINQGVVHEKLGQRDRAARAYARALALNPRAAKAHFNLAVLHWGQDWPRAARELEAALRADPAYEEARRFLAVARAKLASRER